MGTLYLTDLNLEVKERSRDRLFFDQYEYSLSVFLQGISSLRELNSDPEIAKKNVATRLEYRSRFKNFGGNWKTGLSDADRFNDRLEELCQLVDCLLPYYGQFQLTVSTDWGYIYTNNLELIERVAKDTKVRSLQIQKAIVDRPRDTILIGESNYSYRTYFKERRLSKEIKKMLSDFLAVQDDIELSTSLRRMLYSTNLGIQRYHYFNHNNPVINTMISMIAPGLIRTTIPILTK